MGAKFKNLNTLFGTQDEIFSEVRFATLAPTLAYSFNEDMAIGLAANIGWGDMAFKFFPNTSFFNTMAPEMSFFGMDMELAGGLQTNFRLGYWWRMHLRVSLGLTYQSETDSNFEDGDLVVNFDAHPMLAQKVKYSADVDGFNFAAQAGIGLGIGVTGKLLIAIDLKQYYWDDAIDTITVSGTNPSVQGAPDVTVPFVFNWKDQTIYAIGFDSRASDRWTVRWGYNHGENPVPDDTMNPLFPTIVEDHVTFGLR